MATTEWIPTKVISDPTLPFATLVCVDDAEAPTQELTLRLDANVITSRVL